MAIFKKLKSFFTKKNKKEDVVSLEKNKEVEFSKTNLKSDQKKENLLSNQENSSEAQILTEEEESL